LLIEIICTLNNYGVSAMKVGSLYNWCW